MRREVIARRIPGTILRVMPGNQPPCAAANPDGCLLIRYGTALAYALFEVKGVQAARWIRARHGDQDGTNPIRPRGRRNLEISDFHVPLTTFCKEPRDHSRRLDYFHVLLYSLQSPRGRYGVRTVASILLGLEAFAAMHFDGCVCGKR